MKKTALAFLTLMTISMVFGPRANAALITGEFAPNGTAVRLTTNDILFYHLPGFIAPGCPPFPCSPADSTGNIVVIPPLTASFVGRAGETGTIKNLTINAAANPNLAFAPVDTPLAILNWIVLPNAPSITFELTRLTSGLTASAGTAPFCNPAFFSTPGYRCTPSLGSPLLLSNVQTFPGGPINMDVSINALGLAWFVATPADKSNAVIAFTTTMAGTTIGDFLADLAGPGFSDGALAGSILVTPGSATVPEPSTMILSLTGMALMAAKIHRRRRSAR